MRANALSSPARAASSSSRSCSEPVEGEAILTRVDARRRRKLIGRAAMSSAGSRRSNEAGHEAGLRRSRRPPGAPHRQSRPRVCLLHAPVRLARGDDRGRPLHRTSRWSWATGSRAASSSTSASARCGCRTSRSPTSSRRPSARACSGPAVLLEPREGPVGWRSIVAVPAGAADRALAAEGLEQVEVAGQHAVEPAGAIAPHRVAHERRRAGAVALRTTERGPRARPRRRPRLAATSATRVGREQGPADASWTATIALARSVDPPPSRPHRPARARAGPTRCSSMVTRAEPVDGAEMLRRRGDALDPHPAATRPTRAYIVRELVAAQAAAGLLAPSPRRAGSRRKTSRGASAAMPVSGAIEDVQSYRQELRPARPLRRRCALQALDRAGRRAAGRARAPPRAGRGTPPPRAPRSVVVLPEAGAAASPPAPRPSAPRRSPSTADRRRWSSSSTKRADSPVARGVSARARSVRRSSAFARDRRRRRPGRARARPGRRSVTSIRRLAGRVTKQELVALGHLLLDDRARERRQQVLLDRALQRPRAERRAEALVDQELVAPTRRARPPRAVRAARGARATSSSSLSSSARICSRSNGRKTRTWSIRFRNSGRKVRSSSPARPRAAGTRRRVPREAERRARRERRADVRGQDDDAAAEVGRAPVLVGQPPVVEDLEEEIPDRRRRLLELVEQDDRERILATDAISAAPVRLDARCRRAGARASRASGTRSCRAGRAGSASRT